MQPPRQLGHRRYRDIRWIVVAAYSVGSSRAGGVKSSRLCSKILYPLEYFRFFWLFFF